MSTTFNLTNTATEVNTAIQAVVGADTSPDGDSVNMVTSQGVFNYIETQLAPFKSKTVTTESTGIASTDNDTSIPTSAAVKDFVDTRSILEVETFSVALPGGYHLGHPTNENYHNAVTVSVGGFSQILHVELDPKPGASTIGLTGAYATPTENGHVLSFTNNSITFLGPKGDGTSGTQADTGNGYTTTYRVFGLKS